MTETGAEHSDLARLHEQVVEIVAERTLYDESYLLPDSHFEADLGIDSVILESILAAVKEHFGLPDRLSGQVTTLRGLVAAVAAELGRGGAGAAWSDGPDAILSALLSAAQRQTQYRPEQLGLDAHLERDLGIDSVILTSVVAEVAQSFGAPETAPGFGEATTLRELADRLSAAWSQHTPRTMAPHTVTPRTTAPRTMAPRPEPAQAAQTEAAPAPDLPAPGGDAQRQPAPEAAEDGWDGRSMKDFVEQRDPDIFAKARTFGTYLRGREADQLYWYGMPLHSRCENRAVIFDELAGRKREFLMFASNNYLGLANHPRVIEAVCDATRAYGATHTGSRFIGGTNMLHKELERRLAAFKQRPACIVYPGGYSANLGAISALVKSYDTLVVDKLNHMSIVDGAKLSGAGRRIYQHNDMADLERVLKRGADSPGGTLIVADGVFSMHGDICDLPGIVGLAKTYGARVMIDDAHATGVLGARGSGTTEHFNLKGEVDLELGTMSKTLAGMGGFVVGDEEVVEYLRFYSNSYVFAANIPAGVAAGLIASIDVMEAEPERVKRLWTNIGALRARLLEAGFDLENSESAILPIRIGDERLAMEMGRAVRARGLYCQTVVFPGVPLGDARLRVSVTCEHTPEDLELAADIFLDAARETGVLRADR
ncbi:aminotransferase class I/II-fold pyridoxal phosphate-dependent enzyme [Streptomyces sp. NPDC053499]|uniref:aminotransferase class I/II-fold pyridoxal phosphate-dependent enzyme n=1 Tax=Streptomyces sp. NPDC053499 TaxID=3365707 RepID=UPI0037D6DE75